MVLQRMIDRTLVEDRSFLWLVEGSRELLATCFIEESG